MCDEPTIEPLNTVSSDDANVIIVDAATERIVNGDPTAAEPTGTIRHLSAPSSRLAQLGMAALASSFGGIMPTMRREPVAYSGKRSHVCGSDRGGKRKTPKIGRNRECLCGSGRKYKRCCGNRNSTTALVFAQPPESD